MPRFFSKSVSYIFRYEKVLVLLKKMQNFNYQMCAKFQLNETCKNNKKI